MWFGPARYAGSIKSGRDFGGRIYPVRAGVLYNNGGAKFKYPPTERAMRFRWVFGDSFMVIAESENHGFHLGVRLT